MGFYAGTNIWRDVIYQLETSDPVVGGTVSWRGDYPTSGYSNAPIQNLADRTTFLKGKVDELLVEVGKGILSEVEHENTDSIEIVGDGSRENPLRANIRSALDSIAWTRGNNTYTKNNLFRGLTEVEDPLTSRGAVNKRTLEAGLGAKADKTYVDEGLLEAKDHQSLNNRNKPNAHDASAISTSVFFDGDAIYNLEDFAESVSRKFAHVDIEVKVPSDYQNVQDALDRLSNIQTTSLSSISIIIESGFKIEKGVNLVGGDYSKFIIKSEDPVVEVSPNFQGKLFYFENTVAPTIDALFDGKGVTDSGVTYRNKASGCIRPFKGVINSGGSGLEAHYSCTVFAQKTVWLNSNQRQVSSGAGIISWASLVDATGSDVSGSGFYGAQAAAGGILNFREGVANNVARYGVRATNAATVNCPYVEIKDCGNVGVNAFDNSTVNARFCNITNSANTGVAASGGSRVLASDGEVSGSGGSNVVSISAFVSVAGSDLRNAGENGIFVSGAGSVMANGADTSGAILSGVFAERASTVSFANGIANNCGRRGIEAEGASIVTAPNCTIRSCNAGAIQSGLSSVVIANNSDLTLSPAGTRNIYAYKLGKIDVENSSVLTATGQPANTDIFIAWGGTVEASGSDGGMVTSPNTLSSRGVIFKS